MLTIEGNVADLIQQAVETNTLPQLQQRLRYLHNFGGDELAQRVLVRVCGRKIGDLEGSILWHRWAEDRPYMNGGLIQHSDGEWGIHT